MNDFTVINNYLAWNRALWRYFFSDKNANPIINLDDGLIEKIGGYSHIITEKGKSWSEDFLSKTLLSNNDLRLFVDNWKARIGSRSDLSGIRKWNDLVVFLKTEPHHDDVPYYFGMLCAIMHIACTVDLNHKNIRNSAKKYLGKNYNGEVGELIGGLFAQLNTDVSSFDNDRMVGTQRNMGRIKYHTILNAIQRDLFIDFLEINKIKWEYDDYETFVNGTLIPALDRSQNSEIRALVDKIVNAEFYPYFKDILQGNLNYEKSESDFGNKVQTKDIIWHYEMYMKPDGSYTFYIPTNEELPKPLSIAEGEHFVDINYDDGSGYIAEDILFYPYPDFFITIDGIEYLFHNYSSYKDTWSDTIFFKKIGRNAYRQVDNPEAGISYVILKKENSKFSLKEMKKMSVTINGYDFYDIASYPERPASKQEISRNSRKAEVSRYQLSGIGSWFSIILKEGEKVYWKPNLLNDNTYREIDLIKRPQGDNKHHKYYFRLERTSSKHLSGTLVVSADNMESDDYRLAERINESFSWDGKVRKYYLNGWGEVMVNDPSKPVSSGKITARRTIKDFKDLALQQSSNLLIQILYDIADCNGCLDSRAFKKAISFTLEFYGIAESRKANQSIVYALRSLGYIVAYKKTDGPGYINQLIPSYLQKTNYSILGVNNSFMLKGVYDFELVKAFLGNDNITYNKKCHKVLLDDNILKYKPEYVCLPDFFLFEMNDVCMLPQDWEIEETPIAEYLISMMSDMNSFEDYFQIKSRGDVYDTPNDISTPSMIKYIDGKEVLCTKDIRYYTHSTYVRMDNIATPIPPALSRIYCQNTKNKPLCIMEYTLDRRINHAKITFTAKIGVPEVLDRALCDLNLGLPQFERIFIVNAQNIGFPDEGPIVFARTYSNNATPVNYGTLKMALEKLSDRKIEDFTNSSAIAISICRRQIHYTMQLRILKSGKYESLIIRDSENNIISFAYLSSNKAYYKRKDRFEEILGDSINDKLSQVLLNDVNTNGDLVSLPPVCIGEEELYDVRIIMI